MSSEFTQVYIRQQTNDRTREETGLEQKQRHMIKQKHTVYRESAAAAQPTLGNMPHAERGTSRQLASSTNMKRINAPTLSRLMWMKI